MMNAFCTKKAGGLAVLLLLAFSASFRAFAIHPVTPTPVMCEGVSVLVSEFNGGLYELDGTEDVTSIYIVEKTSRVVHDLKDPLDMVTPPAGNNIYVIYYKIDGQLDSLEVSIDVRVRPTLSVELSDASKIELGKQGGYACPGTKESPGTIIRYDYTTNVSEIYVNAPGEYIVFPDQIYVFPQHSGLLTVLAGNGFCPVSEVTKHVDVFEKPTADNIELNWTTSFGEGQPVCATCGFFPRLADLVTNKSSADHILNNAGTVVEWADEPAADKKKEIILTPGTTVKRIHLKFQVQREDEHCGVSEPGEIDTIIDLRITAKDCRPVIPTRFAIQPCESKPLNIHNPFYPTVNLETGDKNKDPKLTKLTTGSYWKVTPDNEFLIAGSSQYFAYGVELENYAGSSTNTQFRISGTAALSCPFSVFSPIDLPYEDTVRTTVDTNFVNIDYRFCPGGKADLKITLAKDGSIGNVVFRPAEAAGLFERRTEDEMGKPNIRCYRTIDPVSDPDRYSPLNLLISYALDNCLFSGDQVEKPKLATRDDCLMKFDVTSEACAGADFTAVLNGNDVDIVVDSIVIDSTGGFAIGIGGFTAADRTGTLTFSPYYDFSSGAPSQSGEIVVTAYYRLAGSGTSTPLSVKKQITAKSCPPYISTNSFSNVSDRCDACPGTRGHYGITFEHPKTDKGRCYVEMVSEPYTPVVEDKWRDMIYYVDCYFYEDTKVVMDVVYNQGDSVCVTRLEAPSYDFHMASTCKMFWKVDHGRDSCCEGDLIDAVVVNASNSRTEESGTLEYYETFKYLVWDEAVLPYVHASCKTSTPYGTGISGEKISLSVTVGDVQVTYPRGFEVKVYASEDGIYPFTVYSEVRGNTVQRRDTLRLYTIPKPHIFIRDTVFKCVGDEIVVDLYIDSSVITSVTPEGWSSHTPVVIGMGGRTFYASAEMRYKCGDGAGDGKIKKDSLVVLADQKVYLALGFNPDKDGFCAQDNVELTVPTNGRVTWYRQVAKEDKLSNPELVGEDMRFNEPLEQTLGSDTLFYTVEARTTCPGDSLRSGSFYVKPKRLPFVDIIEDGFCGSDIHLNADTITAELDGPLKWYYLATGNEIPASTVTVPNGTEVICVVLGRNTCRNSDTAKMVSTPRPEVRVVGGGADNTLCVDKGDTVSFALESTSSSNPENMGYWWYMDNHVTPGDTLAREARLEYVYKGTRDTVIHFRAGTHSVCDTFGRVFIKMNPEPRAETDTTVCFGSDVYFYAPSQAGVIYSWSWLDDDGRLVSTDCNCPLGFAPFESEDARREYTLTFTRGKCVIEQKIHFDTFVDPHLTVTGPEGVCEGAAEVTFLADYDASVIQSAEKPRFKWMTPADTTGFLPNWTGWTSKDVVTPADSGLYIVQALVNGCLYADSVRFKVSPQVTARFVSDAFARSYCEGDSLHVTASDAGDGALYSWRAPNENKPFSSDTVLRIVSLTVADAGSIHLFVKNEYCSDSVYKSIEVKEVPVISITADASRDGYGRYVYCMGDDIVLRIPEALSGDNITWILPSSEVSAPDTPAVWGPEEASDETIGVYAAVLARDGCVSDTARLETTVYPLPVLHMNDTSFCDADGRILVDADFDDEYPDAHYRWSMSNEDRSWMIISDTGFFTVEITLNGCSTVDTFHISRRYAPVWEFDPDEAEICVGDSVVLRGPEDAESYKWETPEGTSTERIFIARRDGYYELTATKSGCSDERGFTLTTDYCTSPLFFAEIFNPNSSVDANRYFGPITTIGPEELDYAMYIYDLNGQLVFKSTDIHEVWNGTVLNGGKECPVGIYYYRCDAVILKSGRDISVTGMIRLLR